MKKSDFYAAAAGVLLGCALCCSAFSPQTQHRLHAADTRPAQKDSLRLHRRRLPEKGRGRSEGRLSTSTRATPSPEDGANPADEFFDSSSSSSIDQPSKPAAAAAAAAVAAGSSPVGVSLNAVAVEPPTNSRFDALVDKGGVSKDRLAFEELGTREMDRLFSTLEPCDVTGFRRKPANVLTAASLIGGTAVGAGILALPAATLQAGLLPSSVGLVMMWVYMVCTALLIAEVNVNVICAQGTPGVGLIALAEQALGKGGARFAGFVYVFIHYSLLVAYMAQGGGLLTESFNSAVATAGLGMGLEALPEWAGPAAFCFALGSLVLFFSEEFVASFNSLLVGVVLASFVALIIVGSGGVQMDFITQQDWSKLPSTVPVLYIAMVFHNVIPVVTTQLEGDVDKIRKAVIGGSVAPLLMFLAWNTVILGSVSKDAGLVAEAAGGVFDPLQALRDNAGSAEGSAALIGPLISVFSEVAIITSFIGFIVGLLDFFTDVLKIPPGDTSKEIPLYGAILLPPLAVAVTDPDIFFAALDTAGTFGISLLCGVLPAAMAWQQRYGGGADGKIATLPLVPGGKATLAGIAGFAGVVIFQKLLEMAGLTLPA